MKIHLLNDLHLEFSGGKFAGYVPPVDADVVVLAGDINPGVLGLMWAAETFVVPVISLAGNHEFYGKRRLHKHYDKMHDKAAKLGIHFLQNESIVIDGVRFLVATLWTDFSLMGNQPLAMIEAQGTMNDYKLILQNNRNSATLMPSTVLHEHNVSMEFLTEELNKDFDGPTVVATHHAPSEQSCLPDFRGNPLNHCYATNLERFVEAFDIALWVHGHIHCSQDYMIGDTRVVCNPRGYEGHAENVNFDPNLLLEV